MTGKAQRGALAGKRVVVGVGGGIAAFKAVVLVRELQRRGADVRVAMTRSATRFVGAVTHLEHGGDVREMPALTGCPAAFGVGSGQRLRGT